MMKIIGLTGNIASGKSSVARMFERLGARIIDADLVAREIVEPEKPAWSEIVDKFGERILNPDRTINRERLGDIVFNNQDKRKILNGITHPRITEEIKRRIEDYRKEDAKAVVVEAALIVENSGWLRSAVDTLVVVSAGEEAQIERLLERSGYTRDEAMSRIRAQMPGTEKEKHGDYVIDNSGTPDETQSQVINLWNEITEAT